MLLKVIVPDNNSPERKYIIDTLLSTFLGLKYQIDIKDTAEDYSIIVNNHELLIRDSFFSIYRKDLSYLCIESLPKKITYLRNNYVIENKLPVIYGTDEFQECGNKIICGADIFASSFFMLTRWEEYVKEQFDEHARFPGVESFAKKNGILPRPIVNEYVEFLWNLLQRLGYNGIRRQRSYVPILTHDIDLLAHSMSMRMIVGDIVKRRNVHLAIKHLSYYSYSGSNPYDTFDFLMNTSERLGVRSYFYFMASDSNQVLDTPYYLSTRRFKTKVREIRSRGHEIGFHPGYSTFNNASRWRTEKQLLEKAINETVHEGRQHYLRFEIPNTFNIWEENHMDTDSSLGYPDSEGYRCGTGDAYYAFDFLERKQLNIKERPLVIMDVTIRRNHSIEDAYNIIRYYISTSKKYHSSLTLLFHNTSFFGDEWEGYNRLYKEALGAG